MNTGLNELKNETGPLPETLACGLRGLRVDAAPGRDLWPGIAGRLQPRGPATQAPGHAPMRVPRLVGRRPAFALRNARYAAAAAVVLATGIGWQLWPGAVAPQAPPPAPEAIVATGPVADADAPLLRAADALAREYQGALREVAAGSAGLVADAGTSGPPLAAAGLDAELARSATEVRAALARDPDALHLLHRLQRIYAHRLALSLRQA
ncbi:hypothetical protein [Luteimonas sp. MC1895]|uniref:hypothetical protein n=1 Tax=Luteimonas sp. MC1895 TaxID=2819513 RepID=UPI0018F0A9F8|nr:hypothetical protein [Luteimonas sp. MC1895]MBJ6978150.1 hypothetical protein [Luteimonas sp. MC1895]